MNYLRLLLSWKALVLLPIVSLEIVLIYLWVEPTYLLQVSVEPRSSRGIEIRRDRLIVISNGREPIFFDIAGDVDNPTLSHISVSVRHPKRPELKKQENVKVSSGSFLATVQLGSAESPITGDESYSYTIDSVDGNSRLSDGNIQLQLKAVVSGTSQWWMITIAAIGLLASVLQVLMFLRSDGKLGTRNEGG